MERIVEYEPAIGMGRLNAGFQMPIGGAIGLFDLGLGKAEAFKLGTRQAIKTQDNSGRAFDFFVANN